MAMRQWLRDSAYEMFRLCPISYNYRFSLFSREIKLCYKLHTIFWTARHMICEFSQKNDEKGSRFNWQSHMLLSPGQSLCY